MACTDVTRFFRLPTGLRRRPHVQIQVLSERKKVVNADTTTIDLSLRLVIPMDPDAPEPLVVPFETIIPWEARYRVEENLAYWGQVRRMMLDTNCDPEDAYLSKSMEHYLKNCKFGVDVEGDAASFCFYIDRSALGSEVDIVATVSRAAIEPFFNIDDGSYCDMNC